MIGSNKGLRAFLSLFVFLHLSFDPGSCAAQDQAAAEALFRSAQKAARLKDWQTACERFEESNRLDPAPGTVLNLGRCRENLGQLAAAWKSYAKAAQILPAADRRASFAETKARSLEPRVPLVTLLPPEGEIPFTVQVAGTRFTKATWRVPLPFDPGPLRIIVRSPGREDALIDLELEEGARVEQLLFVGAPLRKQSASASSGVSSLPRVDGPESRVQPWIVSSFAAAGVGVAAAAAGGVWAAVELPKVREHCDDGACTPKGADAAERGRRATFLSVAGASVAVVGLSLGTVLLVREKEAQFALLPVPGGTMLSFHGKL